MALKVVPKLVSLVSKLSPRTAIKTYSLGRRIFLYHLNNSDSGFYVPSIISPNVLWGLEFGGSVFNAAGIFKDLNCYELACRQGAAAYLIGTLTWFPREGNFIQKIRKPFTIYPKSHASSNSYGLPNPGVRKALKDLPDLEGVPAFPIGVSLGFDPLTERLSHLTESMRYAERQGADFLELNASCPNTKSIPLQEVLGYVKQDFLDLRSMRNRRRQIPVIAKLSNDFPVEEVPALMDVLFESRFDGVNFGNTSTDYEEMRKSIVPEEREMFDYFRENFKGGVSGVPLRKKSLALVGAAADYIKMKGSPYEFHIIQTGGVRNESDLEESINAGASLVQSLSGYSEGLLEYGNEVYVNMFREREK